MRTTAIAALVLTWPISALTLAQAPETVTVENSCPRRDPPLFQQFGRRGGFGEWHHVRELLPIDRQTVIRGNRDTLYSTRVFDLDAGPVTITLPDAGKRFMSLQIITEDQYTTTEYGAGAHKLDKAKVVPATRSLASAPWSIRTIPAISITFIAAECDQVSQPGGPGKFEIPNWDKASQRSAQTPCSSLRARSPIRGELSARRKRSTRSSTLSAPRPPGAQTRLVTRSTLMLCLPGTTERPIIR